MESLYFMIPISLLVLVAATGLLVWAVNSGQYEDIEREGERILQDDDLLPDQPPAVGDEPAGDESASDDERQHRD